MRNILITFSALFIFVCMSGQSKFTDTRDGNVYSTITINGVTWMSENLRFATQEGAHLFDNNSNNLPDYGLLYEWKTAVSACPSGWHLPSGEEFRELANHFEHNDSWKKLTSENPER